MQNAIRQVYEKLAKFRSVVSCKLDMVKSEANTSLGSQYQSGSINLYLIYIGLKLRPNFTLTDVGPGGGGVTIVLSTKDPTRICHQHV